MEDNSNMLESLFHRTEEYVKTSFEIIKLKTLEKSTEIAASMISRFILIAIIFMCLFVLSLGASYWLGELFDKIYFGFLIVAAFWAVAGIVLYFFLFKRIKKRISDTIIKNAF
jgi:Na+/melibiose symporter-like transporter